MITQNLHTHSTFSDGVNTPEELVLAALQKGFTSLGFSEHAFTPYDSDCCVKHEDVPLYFAEIRRLKQKYTDKCEILLGLECDGLYETDKTGLDFTIGSVHYIFSKTTGEYFNIDYRHDIFERALNETADGDIRRLVEIYYNNIVKMALEYKPDIIGHINLITRLNKDNRYFDPKSAWYRDMIAKTAEKISKSGCIVEVNTGGMCRGGLTEPYPSAEFLRLLFEHNVPVTVSSDAHNGDALDYWFGGAAALLRETGYRSIKRLTAGGFTDTEI